jgi:hypothetical protein
MNLPPGGPQRGVGIDKEFLWALVDNSPLFSLTTAPAATLSTESTVGAPGMPPCISLVRITLPSYSQIHSAHHNNKRVYLFLFN